MKQQHLQTRTAYARRAAGVIVTHSYGQGESYWVLVSSRGHSVSKMHFTQPLHAC